MEEEHERSLVAWANTFNSFISSDTYDAPATAAVESLADFASGDLLIPIVRAIVVGHDNSSSGVDIDGGIDAGWAGVFSRMKRAGLIENDAEVPKQGEENTSMAVTCLEALLRHTVVEQCRGRETFIRQIMSLDAAAQATLRHIIVGQQHDQQHECGSSSEPGSPSRESALSSDESFAGSPAASVQSFMAYPPLGHRSAAGLSSEDDSSTSGEPSLRCWFSPDGGSRGLRMSGAASGERAAPVGPKRRHGLTGTLDVDAEKDSVRVSPAASAAALRPVVVGGTGLTTTTVEVCGEGFLVLIMFGYLLRKRPR